MDFIKSIFSDNGNGSWSRVGSFIALLSVIGWGSWVTYKTTVIPPLEGPTFFVVSLYGIARLSDGIVASFNARIGVKPDAIVTTPTQVTTEVKTEVK